MDTTIIEVQPKRRWGRTIKRALLWAVGLFAALVLAGWLYVQVDTYQTFKRDLTEYENVKIGASMAEVRYSLGYPKWVLGENLDKGGPWGDYQRAYEVEATAGPNAMPKGMTVEKMNDWEWQTGVQQIAVSFDPKSRKVVSVSCYVADASTALFECSGLGSVEAGNTEETMTRKLGAPDRAIYDKSSPTKTAFYDKLGLEVLLTKRLVYMIKKKVPGDAGLRWWLSHGRP